MPAKSLMPPVSEEERADVAYQLIRSLDGPEPSTEEQAEVDAAWVEEVERRVKEIAKGTAKLIPAEEVFAEIEQRGDAAGTRRPTTGRTGSRGR